jgi:hypothetical protein
MLSLWTGTLHLWKPLATPPTKGQDGSVGLLLEQNDCREASTQFRIAASAGAARPLARLWSEQASVAGMGWEEPGAEAVEILAEAAPGVVLEGMEREAGWVDTAAVSGRVPWLA